MSKNKKKLPKRKKTKKNQKPSKSNQIIPSFNLPEPTKKHIGSILVFILAVIITLGFFNKAGVAGSAIISGATILIGKAAFILPFILFLGSLVIVLTKYQNFIKPTILAISIFILGLSGFLSPSDAGGYLGYLISLPFLKLFGPLVTRIVFSGIMLIGGLIFWHLLFYYRSFPSEAKPRDKTLEKPLMKHVIKKVLKGGPSLKVKEVDQKVTPLEVSKFQEKPSLELKAKSAGSKTSYQIPLDLLDPERGMPKAGDIRQNSSIIKKTLENFDIPVEMSEVNVGPTVTQYTLKPAEGIKLSKITSLVNNLSLALAVHPIRIEAPIPGKSLVGIEVPNRVRAEVRLRNLIPSSFLFSKERKSNLIFVLGRDVSGNPINADLARMPHLLVAGSTGSGKTIFLNILILSLLYHNSPDNLRLLLVDPKRVEFSVYSSLPHLLTSVIFDAQKTVNALKWLISEMERRFDIFASEGSRDINSYNKAVTKRGEKPMPYIVVVIDELADLMSARGRDIEAGIVRLAQMARAVGIHLVVATQRPSVEVITGLIKANITSRVTFQVASQVDSRTVLDTAGAERLLGAGDMLFLSSETGKPKRIQGAYVSEKEVKRVIGWIESNVQFSPYEFSEDLEKALEQPETETGSFGEEEDPLYPEARRLVMEARKASASFLQRKLRIGYARAARLIDMLEERGVVGPAEGAKPREVYVNNEEEEDEEGWKKV